MKPENIAQWTHREVENLLQSVGKYTRFVHSTKMALIAMIILLTALLLFYLFMHDTDSGVRVAFTNATKGVASPTQMLNAHLHGLDKDNQPFNVTSRTATQEDWNTLKLDKVTGDISLKSGVWVSLSANNGVFYMKEKLLDLKGAIDIFDDQGYEMRTETLHVDINVKKAITRDHVEGQGTLGTLKAEGAIADGIAQTIVFGGPVFVTVYPAQQ